MKEKTIRVFSYNELSNESKQKVLESFRNINTELEWWTDLIESFCQDLEKDGNITIDNKDVEFSIYDRDQSIGVKNREIEFDIENIIQTHKDKAKTALQYSNQVKYDIIVTDDYLSKKSGVWHKEFPIEGWQDTSNMFRPIFEIDVSDSDGDVDVETIETIKKELEEVISIEYKKFIFKLSELFKNLKRWYDEISSDAQVISTIKANEYEFDEDGNLM